MGRRNVSSDVHYYALALFERYVITHGNAPGFGRNIGKRIRVTDLCVSLPKRRATAVCEVVVEQDMLDTAQGTLHTGCSAYLIDMCTALPYITLGLAQEEEEAKSHGSLSITPSSFAMAPFAPSQRLDITYHHPAALGAKLRVTGKSIADFGPLLTVRGEIWDMGLDRLVASAIHAKVMPKKPPLAAKLKL